jgi:hypothetical protein
VLTAVHQATVSIFFGIMADQAVDDDDIFVYTGGRAPHDVRRVRICESIDTIPSDAFVDCTQLIEVEGHNKLKKIKDSAFIRCRSLRWLKRMNGVIEIEHWAFGGCNALSDVDFDKLEIIGSYAFDSCNSLRSINMTSVRRVEEYAFQYCTALTSAVFGKDLERIERNAFFQCVALRRIAIPLKYDLIDEVDVDWEDDVFDECENLSRIDVVGGTHKTISSLHMESWRNEMTEEIDRINQTLPHTPSSEKAVAIRQWIKSVLDKMEHHKTEHRLLVKEAMTLLELALWKANLDENDGALLEGVRSTKQIKRARKERCITSGAGVIIKNVLPFLQLS